MLLWTCDLFPLLLCFGLKGCLLYNIYILTLLVYVYAIIYKIPSHRKLRLFHFVSNIKNTLRNNCVQCDALILFLRQVLM